MIVEYPGCTVRMGKITARYVSPAGRDATPYVSDAIDLRQIRVDIKDRPLFVRYMLEYGAWDEATLIRWTDREARIAIAWLAAGDICEEATAARR